MYKLNKDCRLEPISENQEDNYIIVYEDNAIIINHIAGDMLNYIMENEVKDEYQIIDFFCTQYGVTKDEIETDIIEFVRHLLSKNIIVLVDL